MGSLHAEEKAVKILHYTAPLACAAYFIGASLWSVCALQTLDTHVSKKLKRFVLVIMALATLSCVCISSVLTRRY